MIGEEGCYWGRGPDSDLDGDAQFNLAKPESLCGNDLRHLARVDDYVSEDKATCKH